MWWEVLRRNASNTSLIKVIARFGRCLWSLFGIPFGPQIIPTFGRCLWGGLGSPYKKLPVGIERVAIALLGKDDLITSTLKADTD
jgi:hypothetical protein